MKEPNFEVSMNEYLPLRDVVFNTLRQAILRGELKPGERLMEIQLANKLGVSRTPIREAIRKLELEGLVLMIPRKGAEVAEITEKSLRDVLEVRRALEELAVRLACDKISEEKIQELKEAAEYFRSTLKSGDITKIAEADVKFHDVIYLATDNQKLIQLLHNGQIDSALRYPGERDRASILPAVTCIQNQGLPAAADGRKGRQSSPARPEPEKIDRTDGQRGQQDPASDFLHIKRPLTHTV